jgi:hypothetical protein
MLQASRHFRSPFARAAGNMSAPVLAKLQTRPAETVFGWSVDTTAAWYVARDINNLAGAEQAYAAACAQLGAANRSKVMRRLRVVDAFRAINARRASLRRARQALAASQAAAAALPATSSLDALRAS